MKTSYENIEQKNIWLWGCGRLIPRYLTQLDPTMKIQGILDRDPQKWGQVVAWNDKQLVCHDPEGLKDGAVIVAVENPKAVKELGKYLDDKNISWCHIIEAVDAYFLSTGEGKFHEKPGYSGKMVKFIDCAVPIEMCNLRCSYCYLGHQGMHFEHTSHFYHTPKYVRKALSRERMGGSIFINFCGTGETLLCEELTDIVSELIKEGHYVQIVTNATITKAVDRYLTSAVDLSHLSFKCSLHYLQFKKLGLLETFADNVNRMRQSGASITVEITPEDELIPYIDEIKEYSMKNFGALPHITVTRDEREKDFRILSQYSPKEYREIWSAFGSPMFFFKMEHLEPQRYHDCMAGLWSGELDLATGELLKCVGNPRIGNIYDLSQEIAFEQVGRKCCLPYCFNCHAYLTLGLIPSTEAPTYYAMRDRETLDGSHWITDSLKKVFEQKLYDNNGGGYKNKENSENTIEFKIIAFKKAVGMQDKCIIVGSGIQARKIKRVLENAGYRDICLLTDECNKKEKSDMPIMTCAELMQRGTDGIVLLIDTLYSKQYFNKLTELGYPRKQIFWNAEKLWEN